MSEILANEYRGKIIENVRRGYVCVVDENKKIVFSVGDPSYYAYYRAALKPAQLVPVLKRKLEVKYNFTEPQIVMLASTHNGEYYHIEALEDMMVKAGLIELDMIMKPTYPLDSFNAERLLREGKPQRKIYHSCSGKHIGLMILAREFGPDYQNYWQFEHPAQQEILENISFICEVPKAKFGVGIDGCGVPVLAVPIKNMALSYLKIACPDLIEDFEIKEALEKFTPLVNKHNKYISGTNHLCSVMNEDNNIIYVDGANGIMNIGLKKERLGIAIKIEDGHDSERIFAIIIAHLLEKLNYDNKAIIERLTDLFPETTYNDNDVEIGKIKAVF